MVYNIARSGGNALWPLEDDVEGMGMQCASHESLKSTQKALRSLGKSIKYFRSLI